MNQRMVFSETFFTTVDPKRILRIADECLLEIRLVESRREAAVWIHEFEAQGDSGKIEKFLVRVRKLETILKL